MRNLSIRMSTIIVCLAFACTVFVPQDVCAETYYVSKAGSNSDGLSWSTAFTEVTSLNTAVQNGDTALIGAGIWDQTTIVVPDTLMYGTYPDDTLRFNQDGKWTVYACSTFLTDSSFAFEPVIFGGTVYTSGWVQRGSTNIWAHVHSVWGAMRSYTIGSLNDSLLVPKSSIAAMTSAGTSFEDIGNDSVYVWLYDSSDPNADTIGVAKYYKAPVYFDRPCQQIKFFGLDIAGGSIGLFEWEELGSTDPGLADSITIERCWLRFAGGDESSNAGAFTSAFGQTQTDSTRYPKFYHILACSISNFIKETTKLGNVICTYHLHRVVVESCWVAGAGIGAGFYIKDKAGADRHYGMVLKFSTIRDAGYCVLFQSHYDYDSIYGNYLYNANGGIISAGSNDAPVGGHQFISNNTIYNVKCKGIMIHYQSGVWPLKCGEDNEIFRNIVAGSNLDDCGEDREIIGFEYTDAAECDDYYTINHNMFYDNQATVGDMYRCDASAGDDFAIHWQTGCGFDANGTASTDPDFVDAANGDFERQTYDDSDSTYFGGRWWYIEGAWQPRGGGDPPDSPLPRKRNVLSGGLIK